MQTAGWFAAPALMVPVADATALGVWPSMQQAQPKERYRIIWPMLLVLALALGVAACAALEPLPLFIALLVYAVMVGCCGCLSVGRAGDVVLWLYAGWAVAEVALGITVSFGLRWAAGSLLATNSATAFDSIERQWEMLWVLTVVVYIASLLAALLQVWIIALLAYGVRGHSKSKGGVGAEETLNVQGALKSCDDNHAVAEQKERGSCVLFIWSIVALYVGLLAVTICGFIFHQLWPAGTVFTASTPVSPLCTGCFCYVRCDECTRCWSPIFCGTETYLSNIHFALLRDRPMHLPTSVFAVWSTAVRWVACYLQMATYHRQAAFCGVACRRMPLTAMSVPRSPHGS